MLSKEENELLARVGPGTPAGTLLRRYWHPACFVADLSDERPIKRVKIMHEDLVVFRDKQGNYGCLAEHCSHRGTSLYYGFLENCGLRCAYHGWKYAADGRCLEQPFEPPGSTYKDRVQHPAYPVQKLAGLLFVYLGPQPAPLLPRWDVLAWTDGRRRLMRQEDLNCNWLQAMENSADVTHTYFLHGHTLYQLGERGREVEYYHRPIEQFGFQTFEWGLVKSWRYAAGESFFGPERGGGNPLVFPNILRVMEGPLHAMHWRVPIDDTHTRIIHAGFLRGKGQQSPEELDNPPVEDHVPQKRPDGEYAMDTFFSQDKMAWETQGPIFDRSQEHLGASDRGVVLYRQMVREQIERVQRGEDPLGTIRDPAGNQCIELPAWLAELDEERFAEHMGELPVGRSMDAVFDERHEIFEVPFGAARPGGG
jgi:5,5'-dehydrodivanillate O-demethylase oxygenase subunit